MAHARAKSLTVQQLVECVEWLRMNYEPTEKGQLDMKRSEREFKASETGDPVTKRTSNES